MPSNWKPLYLIQRLRPANSTELVYRVPAYPCQLIRLPTECMPAYPWQLVRVPSGHLHTPGSCLGYPQITCIPLAAVQGTYRVPA